MDKEQVQLRLHAENKRRLKVMAAELNMTMDGLINFLSLLFSTVFHGKYGHWQMFSDCLESAINDSFANMERENLSRVRAVLVRYMRKESTDKTLEMINKELEKDEPGPK